MKFEFRNIPFGSPKVAMAVSTFSRLFMGLAVFIVLARYLGPTQFGMIAGAMAYSGLLNLLSDFGLGIYALRIAGAEPKRNVEIVRRALLVKVGTTIATVVFGAVLLVAMQFDEETIWVYVLIFSAVTVASFADLSFVVVRAVGRNWVEARTVTWTSILSLIIVAQATILTQDVLAASLAFFTSRLLFAVATVWSLNEWLLQSKATWPTDIQELKKMGQNAVPYAIDGALTNLSNQIDVLMVTVLLTPAAVGTYQSGARLVQTISPFAVILSTVYLPLLAQAHHSGNQTEVKRLSGRINLEFTALAILGYLGFLLCGPLWTNYVLGPEYEPLLVLWPGFAVFVLFRFLGSAFGIQLAAFGEMKYRIASQAGAISVVLLADALLLPLYGVKFASWVLACSSIIPFVVYAMAALKISQARNETILCVIIAAVILIYHACDTWLN